MLNAELFSSPFPSVLPLLTSPSPLSSHAAGLFAAVLLLLVAGVAHSQETVEEEDDDGRLLIITSTGTGTNVLPTFPIVDFNTLTNANVTVGLGAALLAATAIAGLTAATITLAILLGIHVKKGKKYDDYDYGYSGSS